MNVFTIFSYRQPTEEISDMLSHYEDVLAKCP